MSREPVVTVITLVYNTGRYVIQAIESVRNQTHKNIQHIIIDDCSTDDSVDIVKNWISKNNYTCELLIHQQNMGISKSLNEGLKLAKGKYVTFVSDDLFSPQKLNRQASIMENLSEEYAFIYSDIELFNSDSKEVLGTLLEQIKSNIIGPEGDIFETLYSGNFIHGSAALFRMSAFNAINYYNESLIVEDIDMLLRMTQKFKVKFDNEISARYRIHNKSLLKTIGVKGIEANIQSLEPFYNYSKKTKEYFVNYLSNKLPSLYYSDFSSWKIRAKQLWKIKKDLLSFIFLILSSLGITYEKQNKFVKFFIRNILRNV